MISNFSDKTRHLLSNALTFGRAVAIASVAATTLVVVARHLGTLQAPELAAFDQLIRLRPDEGLDDRILLVAITEEDIQSRKEYPISDGTLAQVLKKIEQYEPRAIGIDIIRDAPQGTGRAALTERLSKSDRIIAICKASSADNPGVPPAPGIPEDRVGFADFPIDSGGILRRSLLSLTPVRPKIPPQESHVCNNSNPENQLISLDLQLALRYLEPLGIQPTQTPSGNIKIGSTVFNPLEKNDGGYKNADVGGYQFLVNYRSPRQPVKQVSITDLLKDKVNSASVKDRIVLVGYTAPSVKDDFYTPYSAGQQDNQKMPGVVIHAQAVSQILSAVLNKRPLFWFWPEWGEVLWILGWSLVGGTLAWRIRRPLFVGLAEVTAIGILFGTCYILITQAGWIPLIPSALALIATAGSVVLVERGGAKAIIKKIFPKIDINQEERQKQVAETVGSDFFRELEVNAEVLRKRRLAAHNEGVTESNNKIPLTIQPSLESQPPAEDYLQQLQQKASKIKNRDRTEDALLLNETTNHMNSLPEPESTPEVDYLAQLLPAKQIKNRETPTGDAAGANSDANINNSASKSASEPVPEIDYLAQLQQKASKIKNRDNDSHTEAEKKSNSETAPVREVSFASPPTEEIDYLGQLLQPVMKQPENIERESQSDREASVPQVVDTRESRHEVTAVEVSSYESEIPLEMDYFYQLQQIAKELQKTDAKPHTPVV